MPIDLAARLDSTTTIAESPGVLSRTDGAVVLIQSPGLTYRYDSSEAVTRWGSIFISTTTLLYGAENEAYTDTITASGGSESGYTWNAVSGTIPPGLAITASGTPSTTISGTPTAAGEYEFIIRVTDSSGNQDFQSYLIIITAADICIPRHRVYPYNRRAVRTVNNVDAQRYKMMYPLVRKSGCDND